VNNIIYKAVLEERNKEIESLNIELEEKINILQNNNKSKFEESIIKQEDKEQIIKEINKNCLNFLKEKMATLFTLGDKGSNNKKIV
jgi:hypothetical protein